MRDECPLITVQQGRSAAGPHIALEISEIAAAKAAIQMGAADVASGGLRKRCARRIDGRFIGVEDIQPGKAAELPVVTATRNTKHD